MRVDGILERAQLEPRTSDHAATITGAIWFRTDTGVIKYANGSSVASVTTGVPDNSTIENASDVLRVKDAGITRAKLAALGQQLSSSNNGTGNNSTSYADVTNLSVTITTTGRPVFVGLVHNGITSTGEGAQASLTVFNSTGLSGWSEVAILRDSTIIAQHRYGDIHSASGSTFTSYNGSLPFQIDTGAAAGTYTYKIQTKVNNANTTIFFIAVKLIAFEL